MEPGMKAGGRLWMVHPCDHQYSFYPGDPDFGKETPFVPHPDNIKDYFETGHTWNNSISFSGGGQNTLFRLSYNNTDMKGIEPNTWLKKQSFIQWIIKCYPQPDSKYQFELCQ